MATTKGKTTGTKKAPAKKPATKRATTSRTRKPAQQSAISWPAIGMVMVAVGVIFLVCLLTTNNAPAFVYVRGFLNGTFGMMGFIAAILLVLLGLQTAFGERWPLRRILWVELALLFVCVATLLQVFQVDNLLHLLRSQGYVQNYNGFLWKSYDIGYGSPVGGGSLGALLAYPMVKFLDVLGSALVLFFSIFAIILWIIHTLSPSAGTRFSEWLAEAREDFAERREERAAEREARLAEQAAYEAQQQANAADEALLVPLPTDLMQGDMEEAPPPRNVPKGRRVTPQKAQKSAAPHLREVPPPPQQMQLNMDVQATWDAPQEEMPWTPAWDEAPAPQQPVQQAVPPTTPKKRTRLYIEHNVPGRRSVQTEAFTEGDAEAFKYATRPSRKDEEGMPEILVKRRERDNDAQATGLYMEEDTPPAPLFPKEEPHIGMTIEAISGPVEEITFPPEDALYEPPAITEIDDISYDDTDAYAVPYEESLPEPEPPRPPRRAAKPMQNPLDRQPQLDPATRLDRPDWQPEEPVEAIEPEEVPYRQPPFSLLEQDEGHTRVDTREADAEGARKLEETLKSFGVTARVIKVVHGPAITRYELQPAPGVKVSKIVGLTDDIALNMAAIGVRIEAPIPGKAAIGIELANDEIQTVHLRDVLESDESRRNQSKLAVALGKDIAGKRIIADLAKMPHLLIAGATGSGKSVCINTLITSIIYRATPEEVRLILIDPKKVELAVYNGIPHLLVPVVTDPKKASGALAWAVMEMDERYKLFAEVGVRDIKGYNAHRDAETPLMPQIVVIIDELSDLMLVAPGEVEESICRIAQLARACGIHLVIATQRPSVNVITGIIKANVPSRIAFAVSSQVDSRTILDGAGAEKLLGRGDMLFAPSGGGKPLRVQGCFVSDDEVKRVVDYVKNWHTTDYSEAVIEALDAVQDNNTSPSDDDGDKGDQDALFEEAVEVAIESGQVSISMLQRRLRVGYARAGRLVDGMERLGIVAQADGAKPREVLMTREDYKIKFGK